MKNTWRIWACVALALALVALPGLAAETGGPGGGHGQTAFNLAGTILELDGGLRTITVEVETPENLVKLNPLTVTTTSETKFKQCDEAGDSFAIDFGDLEVGKMVKIAGQIQAGEYVATRVIQH